ncbi:MAG: DUF4339 domain-containing protein [Verrucomicrobiales bacterium]|jgi:hypothetical protein|nr:DUF4339 domain-containing protein [Verrucomicrobiales bacterium]
MQLYLQNNGQAAGPYPPEQIKQLIADGTITPEHPAADSVGGPWKPLREWPVLTKLAAVPAPSAAGLPPPLARSASASASAPDSSFVVAGKDALAALKKIAADPTGGIAPAFDALGEQRALGAGLVFGGVFAACGTFAAYRIVSAVGGFLGGFYHRGGGDAGQFFKILFAALAPFLALTVAVLAARKLLRGATAAIGADVFVAGAALLPLGAALLLGSLLGAANYAIVALVTLVALTLTVLMLDAGCVGVAGLSRRAAAWAVPFMLLLSAWLAKVIYTL